MNGLLRLAGHIAAVFGVLICLITGLVRVGGQYYFLGFEAQTLFIGGIALMVMACLARLYALQP